MLSSSCNESGTLYTFVRTSCVPDQLIICSSSVSGFKTGELAAISPSAIEDAADPATARAPRYPEEEVVCFTAASEWWSAGGKDNEDDDDCEVGQPGHRKYLMDRPREKPPRADKSIIELISKEQVLSGNKRKILIRVLMNIGSA